MSYAKIPSAYGQGKLITGIPSQQQTLVDQGIGAADGWIRNNQGLTHDEFIVYYLKLFSAAEQKPVSDGFWGRIHQRLKAAEMIDPSAVIAAGSEMTHTLLEMAHECLSLSREGHLTASSAGADYLSRLENLAGSITEMPASARHEGGPHD